MTDKNKDSFIVGFLREQFQKRWFKKPAKPFGHPSNLSPDRYKTPLNFLDLNSDYRLVSDDDNIFKKREREKALENEETMSDNVSDIAYARKKHNETDDDPNDHPAASNV